eukprot:scaffold1711_cov235-Skeletonema_marinoi.AAC.1
MDKSKLTKKQCSLRIVRGVCWRHEAKANAKQCGYEGCSNGVVNSGFLLRRGAKRNMCSGKGCKIVLSKEEYANVTVQMSFGKFAEVKGAQSCLRR